MAVQGEMLHSLFRVTHRMLHSHETARSRVLAAQASHVFMQVVRSEHFRFLVSFSSEPLLSK